jgi:hypothetical protein
VRCAGLAAGRGRGNLPIGSDPVGFALPGGNGLCRAWSCSASRVPPRFRWLGDRWRRHRGRPRAARCSRRRHEGALRSWPLDRGSYTMTRDVDRGSRLPQDG